MAKKKHHRYLSAIAGKAWKEFSFIEAVGEAIGGFILAFILLGQGWISGDSATELRLDGVGCAILIPVICFFLRMFLAAPAELVKELLEGKKGEEIEPKSIYPVIVAMLLGVCGLLIAGLVFKPAQNSTASEEKHNPSYETLAKQIVETNKFASRETARANQAEAHVADLSKIEKAIDQPDISYFIERTRIKWDDEWQKAHSNISYDPKQIAQRAAEYVRHSEEQIALKKLAEDATEMENIKNFYPIWSVTLSNLKEKLSVTGKRFGGEAVGGELPLISEIMSNNVLSTFITFTTNSTWKCRCEFKEQGDLNFECQGKDVRNFLGICNSESNLVITLWHRDPNTKGQDIIIFSAKCPISSPADCVTNLDVALQTLVEDQQQSILTQKQL
jgi:hypothetical protein